MACHHHHHHKRSRLEELDTPQGQLRCKNPECRHALDVSDDMTPLVLQSQFHVQLPEEEEWTAFEYHEQPEEALRGGLVLKCLVPLYVVRRDYVVCPKCLQKSRVSPAKVQTLWPHVAHTLQHEYVPEQFVPEGVLPGLSRIKAVVDTPLSSS